jgi:hypothetical protein
MSRFKITTKEKWEFDYNGHQIVVTNGFDKTELTVDGKTQDAQNGLTLSATLHGNVDGQPIKVSLGGFWSINCSVFVNNEELPLVKKYNY